MKNVTAKDIIGKTPTYVGWILVFASILAAQVPNSARPGTPHATNAISNQDRSAWRKEQALRYQSHQTEAAWITAIITSIGVMLLLLTLREAQRTTTAALDASKAARDANDIMREEQRAWVKIDSMDWANPLYDVVVDPLTDPKMRICERQKLDIRHGQLNLHISNIGQSIAHNGVIAIARTTLLEATDHPATLKNNFQEAPSYGNRLTLFPSEHSKTFPKIAHRRDFPEFTQYHPTSLDVYLKVRIEYQTLGDKKLRNTIQCFKAEFLDNSLVIDGLPAPNWRITELPYLRDAD